MKYYCVDNGELTEHAHGALCYVSDAEAAIKAAVEAERDKFLEFLRGHESITDRQVQDYLWAIRARGEK